jgi:hypothetical protein
MSVNCDVTVQWGATPEQLTVLGGALWRWCVGAAGNTGIYQYLDNQPLADLIAGTFPRSGQVERGGTRFRLRDVPSPGRQAAIDSLRRSIPVEGVEDIAVDGISWKSAALKDRETTQC